MPYRALQQKTCNSRQSKVSGYLSLDAKPYSTITGEPDFVIAALQLVPHCRNRPKVDQVFCPLRRFVIVDV